MATATEVFNSMKDITKALATYAKGDSTDFRAQTLVFNQAYTGQYASQLSSSFQTLTNKYGEVLAGFASIYQAILYDLLATSTLDLGGSTSNFTDCVNKIRDWMNTNAYALLKQTMTLTMGAITGTGNGLRQYVSVDRWAYENQAIMPGDVKLKCIIDSTMGVSSGNEVFELIPDSEGTDAVTRYAKSSYGVGKTYKCIDPCKTNFVTNGFWSTTVGTAPTVTTLTGWTFNHGAVTNLILSTALYWRATNQYSILFANTSGAPLGVDEEIEVYQKISKTLYTTLPYTGYVVYRNETNGATADITLTVGNKSTTVSLPDVSGVAGAITLLEWKKDQDSWLESFRGTGDINITLNVTNKTGMANNAGVRIYGVFFSSMGSLGRMPFLLTAGSSDFIIGDYFNFNCTYTAGTGLIVQSLREQLGASLPWMLPTAAAGTPGKTVIADPT